jgi:hypothetical protein
MFAGEVEGGNILAAALKLAVGALLVLVGRIAY